MTDILLRHAGDGGDLEAIGGRLTLTESPEVAAYLSILGGNERDGGGDADEHLEWWGNKIEQVPARRLRSRTQKLLASLPLVPANLLRFEAAASADLAWFTESKIATYAGAAASIPALNTLRLELRIEIDGAEYPVVITREGTAAT